MVNEKKQSIKSSVLKSGRRTFFFDVNLASNDKRYLKITESRFIDDEGNKQRISFVLFPEDLQNFQSRLDEVASDLN